MKDRETLLDEVAGKALCLAIVNRDGTADLMEAPDLSDEDRRTCSAQLSLLSARVTVNGLEERFRPKKRAGEAA